jgi:predicted DNA-binding WGR domain protein
MKRLIAAVVVFAFLVQIPTFAGLDSKKAMYVGGTVGSIQEKTEGKSSTADEKFYLFSFKGGELKVPYGRINDLEYGQKAGRRLGLALTISPWLLFSKKRKHFLTVGFQDDNDKQQAAVFELGKDIVRTTLASLEARTGKKIDYQDDEARKSGLGK